MIDLDTELGTMALLKFKDFFPVQKSKNIWTGRGKYGTLQHALQDANAWITAHPEIELLNIETVVLPNIHSHREEGTEDPELKEEASAGAKWHQIFRVLVY